MIASASDFEEEVSFPDNILEKYNHLNIYTKLLDSHLYILRHWVIEFLKENNTFSTIKGELIPYVVSKQHPVLEKKKQEQELSMVPDVESGDIFHFAQQFDTDVEHKIRSASTYMDHKGDMNESYHGDFVRCYAHVTNNFGMRINNLPAYWSINGKVGGILLVHGYVLSSHTCYRFYFSTNNAKLIST